MTSGHTSKVVRYDLGTGLYIDDFATAVDGLDYTRSLTFHNGALYVTSGNNGDVVRLATTPAAVFTVSLTAPSNFVVEVDFETSDGSANADSDFTDVIGKITFAPGVTQRTILVPTLDDSDVEGDETFFVNLSTPSVGTSISKSQGIGTIEDDDAPVASTMHVADLDATTLGSRGKWNATVTITVHDAGGNPIADATVNGIWSDGASGTAICTTDADGQCTVMKNGMKSQSVTFTVTSLVHASLTYDPLANHDEDDEDDSNGTEILIDKP